MYQHHHHAVVTYTRRWRDWFRRRYWVRCWECELCLGPYAAAETAHYVENLLDRAYTNMSSTVVHIIRGGG